MDITNADTGEVHTIDEETLSSEKAMYFSKMKEKMEFRVNTQLALRELDQVITMYANMVIAEEPELEEDAE